MRAEVVDLGHLSGHADRDELVRWLAEVQNPKHVFVTHGEPDAASAFIDTLRTKRGWTAVAPAHGESFDL